MGTAEQGGGHRKLWPRRVALLKKVTGLKRKCYVEHSPPAHAFGLLFNQVSELQLPELV